MKTNTMDYPVEIFDQMQKLYDDTGFSDHMLHCQIAFAEPPDAILLRQALHLSFEAIPILATRFCEDNQRARWQSLDPASWDAALCVVKDETAFQEEFCRRIPEAVGPQVRWCLLSGNRSALSISMNHMIADGAGFRDYLYLVSDFYAALRRDPEWRPEVRIDGNRGLNKVLGVFGRLARLGAWLAQFPDSNRRGSLGLRFDASAETRPFIVTQLVGKAETARLTMWCKQRGVTLNDALLAAYHRVLVRHIGPAALKNLEIPFMIDMRRYLDDRSFTSLANLTSTATARLAQDPGESWEVTVLKVKTIMDGLKRQNLGLGGLVKMSLLNRWVDQRLAVRLIKGGLRHPLICMTNIGPIDPGRLRFGDSRVNSAFICGSIKYRPHFQMAVSGFDGSLTLSANLYGSPADQSRVQAILADVAAELDLARSTTP